MPQQVRVMLAGLRTLRPLKLSAYLRAGRLSGLEARVVEAALADASGGGRLTGDEVLTLLMGLVDQTRKPPDKTPPLAAHALAGGRIDLVAAEKALVCLDRHDIVRLVADTATGAAAWQLDHAYLAQPILRVERERNKWQRLLAERAKGFADAGWRGKWSGLLTVRDQAGVVWARIGGRVRYGPHRWFAVVSLARGMPAVAIGLALGTIGWGAWEYENASRIEAQLDGRRLYSSMSADMAAGEQALARSGWLTRWKVSHDLFTDPIAAGRFSDWAAPTVRAVVGLDSTRLERLVKAHISDRQLVALASSADDRQYRAAVALAEVTSLRGLGNGMRAQFWSALETVNAAPSSSSGKIGAAISRNAYDLAADQSRIPGLLAALREAIDKTDDPDQLPALGQAYASVAGKLRDGDAEAGEELAALREAIGKATYPSQLSALGQAYASIAGTLRDGDAKAGEVLAALREAISKPANWLALPAVGQAYAAVARTLRDGDAKAGEELAALHEAIGKTADPDRLSALGQAYAAVAGTLRAGDVKAGEVVLAALREAISKPANWLQLSKLGQAYASVARTLQDGDAKVGEMLAALREAIGKAANPYQLPALGQAYASVAGTLRDGDARANEELAALREAIGKATDPNPLPALGQAYAAVAGTLRDGDPKAGEVLAALREAIGKTTDPSQLAAWWQAYASVAGALRDGDPKAGEVLAALREAIGKATNPDQLAALWQAYASVSRRAPSLSPPLSDLATLLARLPDLRSPEQCDSFAGAIGAMLHAKRAPLTWDRAGHIVAATLLHPVCAEEASEHLVRDYEAMLREAKQWPTNAPSWEGDVWGFASWAQKQLPGFDPHRANVDLLPHPAGR